MQGDLQIHQSWLTLCHTKTVLQASLLSLPHLVTAGKIPPDASITILSDSQSALKALTNPYVSSKTVQECLQTLQDTSTHHSIRLTWEKAHVGTRGNEMADALAKR
jgi:ribonuclease HI